MNTADFTAWRKRLGLNKSQAARLLGMSRTTIDAYERGATIPRHVELACLALEAGLGG